MKFFIDTANLEEIQEAESWGILDGVTTNPTLLSREEGNYKENLKKICEVVDGPVSGEVVSLEADGMVEEAREIAAIHDNMVVKIPITLEGLKAIKRLTAEGIKTNTTLVFSPLQALIAAKAGTTFVSPFVGRMDDIQSPGMDVVEKIVKIYDNYDFETEIIVASIRNPIHIVDAGIVGADICTIPYKVIKKLVSHPKTDEGIERFLQDWEKVEKQ
ncbi:MAG: fructose-6-phosphate aldolase [Candidatus Marinimicrobia bacterium]|nr:fructose-6-phosphate aldolase [Candidatus Neomarinimicrobiota bacterium]